MPSTPADCRVHSLHSRGCPTMSPELLPPAVCRAGCARANLTPPVGASLAGYFHDRVSESVRDDLFANAMVLESHGTRVALVSCDLISVALATTAPAKELIEAETGIPPDHVLISATHTHTGPELRENAIVPALTGYVETLPRLIADAVRDAAEAMVPVTLHAGRTQATGYSFNRLFRLKDGAELFGRRGDQAVKEAGPIDPELQTLSLVDEEGNLRGLALNFALHPDVIGGGGAKFLSADWPGEIAKNVRAVYGGDVVTVFLQGTCGDINHCIHTPTHLPAGGPKKAVQLGRALAGAAMYAAERAEPMSHVPLAAKVETLSIPYYTRDDAFRAELAALKAKPNPSDFEQYIIQRGENWPHDGQQADVPVQTMRLGDIGLVALPAEIFVRIGLEIKHFSPAPHTFVVELANARSSTYVPTTDQAERGAYGAKPILSRWLCADAGRRMADAAQVMLWELWE
ncbi:MAG: hypothetical protein COY42_08805 [Armatimonadetes bacterium CG_4_10_14_0_8_um_filter_66_14]|nr:MAG: hypothetical protein COY42_08805 [Armatimonadetes bacterium CG_4_10_14_0_8_um_filter_66_14]